MTKSVEFFESQFRQQVANSDLALNPFETAALPHLHGRVLDFGCGLGNLAIAAARRGCSVRALDAAPTAIQHLRSVAAREGLAIEAEEADLRAYKLNEDFDVVVAIGLLMFFNRDDALKQLDHLQASIRPGGKAVVNVLVDRTTYLDMFDPAGYYLFAPADLRNRFQEWDILSETFDDFPAPHGSVKAFVTLIASKPQRQ